MDPIQPNPTTRVHWHDNDIIRHKLTGKPYRIIHIWIDRAIELMDLESKNALEPVILLKPSHYNEFAKDRDFTFKEERLSYEPITI